MMCSFEIALVFFFFFKQKTAYEMRISDWSSYVCSSDLSLSSANERLLFIIIAINTSCGFVAIAISSRVEASSASCNACGDIAVAVATIFDDDVAGQIGRASCRERVCQYV